MTLSEANKLLSSVEGRSMAYQIGWWGKGRIKTAIRIVFTRKSATKNDFERATAVQGKLLRYEM